MAAGSWCSCLVGGGAAVVVARVPKKEANNLFAVSQVATQLGTITMRMSSNGGGVISIRVL